MKRLAWILAFLIGPPLPAADYAGAYKGEQLSVTLAIENGQYTGTIRLADQKFPCTARAVGDELRGTFTSGDDKFQFVATLQGNTLTLVTGNTTYRLQKQKSAAQNPLAKPAAEGRAPANRPGTPQTEVLRFKKASIQDQPNMIGGEAFTFLAPVDWQVEGGLVWRAHPTMPAAAELRVRNPKNMEQLECFPTVGFSWGGYLAATGFPPGSNYLGNEVQPPVRDAAAYLKERHVPRTRGSIRTRFAGEEELPKLAEAARAAEPAPAFGGPQMQFTAAKVRIEYEMNGRPVELPSGYNNAWVNSAGEYIVTDSSLYDPNVEIGGNWQKLQRQ